MAPKIKRIPSASGLIRNLAGGVVMTGFAASVAQAGLFDGKWRPGPDVDCEAASGPSGWIEIEDDSFRGVESQCTMASPVNVRDMDAILYDMQCKAGDSEWTDRAMLLRAADGGLIMVWNGFAFKYESCPLVPEGDANEEDPAQTPDEAAEIGNGPAGEVTTGADKNDPENEESE